MIEPPVDRCLTAPPEDRMITRARRALASPQLVEYVADKLSAGAAGRIDVALHVKDSDVRAATTGFTPPRPRFREGRGGSDSGALLLSRETPKNRADALAMSVPKQR